MRLEELAPQCDPAMAVRFFEAWYGHDKTRFMVVSQMLPGLKKAARHVSGTPTDMQGVIASAGLDDLVYADGNRWNLYMGVGVMGVRPGRGKKGGKRDMVAVPGVWVDLDTDKEGFFRDEEHCLEFLRGLPILPNIVVATGSGGVHAYWKTTVELSAYDAEELAAMWWAYLQREAGVKIDKLTNCDRLMKLPGSVRWPKSPEDQPALVRLVYAGGDPVRPYDLQRLSAPAWAHYKANIDATRELVTRGRSEAAQWAADLAGWDLLMALTTVEEDFNERYTWEQILAPLGWTALDTDGEGRTIWARPGLSEWELHKSAATDYNGSHAMSLFSDSESTGLADLKEAGVPLTKYRVYVQCVWNGDEAAFIREYVKTMGAAS